MNISVQRVSTVVPTDDLAGALRVWKGLLGVEPTFVDGDRWTQFDVAGARIALSGTDRVHGAHDAPALMVRVADLEEARADALAMGLKAGEVTRGPHESRCVVTMPGPCAVILYSSLPG